MRYELLYGTIFISLLLNLGGLFLLFLQAIGIDQLTALRDRITHSEVAYIRRKRKILVVSFLVLIVFFFILRVGYFDFIRLGVTIFVLFSGLLVFFFLFVVFFNIGRLVSGIEWLENRYFPGIMGMAGFLLVSLGLALNTCAILVFLSYQLR